MTGVGLILLALGISDLICGGLAGHPQTQNRCVSGVLVGCSSAILLGLVVGLDETQIVWLGGGALLVIVPWVWFRRFELYSAEALQARIHLRSRNTWRALAWISASLLLVIGAGSLWMLPDGGVLHRWLDGLPYSSMQSLQPEQVVLAVGVLSCLFATSNAIVRTVLIAADPALVSSAQRLRGGRLIGILERLLIFGLAAAGQLTAAAFITSAKSILRFPELSRVAREPSGDSAEALSGVDAVTEYFLLGSLTSWLLALAPVLLF